VVRVGDPSLPGRKAQTFAGSMELRQCTGQIYSVNDARYFDWPEGLRRYIDDIRQGRGQNPKQYSARYVCSLVRQFYWIPLHSSRCVGPSDFRLLQVAALPGQCPSVCGQDTPDCVVNAARS